MPSLQPALWVLPGLLLAAVVIAVVGWGQTPVPEEVRVIGTSFPRTVESGGGRFELPAPPGRILLASTVAVDFAAALVEPERIVALPDQAFTWSVLALDPGGFGRLRQFHDYLVETVVALEPDLVLCSRYSAAQTTAQLRALGVPLVALAHARDLDSALAQLELVGRLTGTEARAAALSAELRRRVAALRAEPGRRHGRRAMTYVNLGSGAWTNGGRCMADALLALAGLRNAGAETGREDAWAISAEELLALDPELLIVARPLGQAQDRSEALLLADPNLASLPALREDRIVHVHPLDLATTSHAVVAAAERLAAAVEARLAR